ncbi:MAG: hypothetical protein RRZ84_07850 [Romboutsia sp.]
MGCRYACTCSGNCLSCSSYQPEEYCGHAEDIYDRGIDRCLIRNKEHDKRDRIEREWAYGSDKRY